MHASVAVRWTWLYFGAFIIMCAALKYRERRLLRQAKDINILYTRICIERTQREGYLRDWRRLREKANRSDR